MLIERDWSPRNFITPLEQYFFSFTLSPENICMTSVGHDPERTHHEIVSSDSEGSDWIYPEQEITRFLVEAFRKIPQVKSICAQFGSEEITIWTLLEGYDREAREQVYQEELKVCRKLHVYDFDFRASSVDLVSPEELIQAGSREIYRRP